MFFDFWCVGIIHQFIRLCLTFVIPFQIQYNSILHTGWPFKSPPGFGRMSKKDISFCLHYKSVICGSLTQSFEGGKGANGYWMSVVYLMLLAMGCFLISPSSNKNLLLSEENRYKRNLEQHVCYHGQDASEPKFKAKSLCNSETL